jgi:hypothetical protein
MQQFTESHPHYWRTMLITECTDKHLSQDTQRIIYLSLPEFGDLEAAAKKLPEKIRDKTEAEILELMKEK